MNVASKELCQELYELSGWGDYPDRTHFSWRQYEGKTTGSLYYSFAGAYSFDDDSRTDPFDGRRPTGITHNIDVIAPAYDAGYLLRKLPGHVSLTSTNWDDVFVKKYSGNDLDYQACACFQSGIRGLLVQQVADTPEDAACKLAIELFKQGILTK